jgi:5-methylcytosine-specific restriction endonuclease McrBC GTP-binding regulatory subunit McrB
MNEYQKFKKLLEYFVAHLEYCVNNNNQNRGYADYIQPINNIRRSGQGYDDDGIQSQIKEWERYSNGKICINVNATTYTGRGTYLNWKHTGLNVMANWDITKKKIIKFQLMHSKGDSNWSPIKDKDGKEIKNTISDLGLFDNQEPNNTLKSFFDEFNRLITEHNKQKTKTKNMEKIKPYIDLLLANKNLILTGAPGTGKTYLAKQIAEAMKAEWTFVQFHPSYDYTDFVEGLRPTSPDENGNIGFERKNGVFKDFCKKALKATEIGGTDNFDEAWEKLIELVKGDLANKTLTKIGSWDYGLSRNNTLKYSSENTPSQYTFTLTKDNIYAAYRNEKARPSGAFQKDMEDVVKYLKEKCNLKDYKVGSPTNENKSFVFIIDEINRGEISKIFGELFFSIDPSYRGEKGKVQTQYANLIEDGDIFKGDFYVPENVYIIGTMNDIDRSVESFDFAMRRRFTWKEITAEESQRMFENETWKDEAIKRMNALNNVISNIQGLGAAYHIGAAYFKNNLPKYADNPFENLWNYHLKSLLFEYLRGMPDAETKLTDLKTAYNEQGN